jgi:hypothetical protein
VKLILLQLVQSVCRQTQALCDAEQALIARPERRSAAEPHCGEQVRIDIADSRASQPMPADEVQHFLVGSRSALRQIPHGLQYKVALPQFAQGKLADYKRMREDAASIKKDSERLIARAQMVDPNRGVDQDHADLGRLRRGGLRFGSLPPRRASRRALSRSISALSASRTRADFSRRPVKACALANNSSSRARVVRIEPLGTNLSSDDV